MVWRRGDEEEDNGDEGVGVGVGTGSEDGMGDIVI